MAKGEQVINTIGVFCVLFLHSPIGNPMLVNFNYVTQMYVSDVDQTTIRFDNQTGFVKETPEEIAQLIDDKCGGNFTVAKK